MMISPVSPDQSIAPQISVIMVSYNTADMTVAAIRSLYETGGDLNFELLVYDNDSSDGSADAIAAAFPEKDYPNMRLVRLTENVGFARANNMAAVHARGDYLLLLNPDTVVLDGAVQALMAFAAERPEARIWGARNILGDGRLDPGSVWGNMTLWSVFCYATGLQKLFPNSALFNPEGYGGWDRTTERPVDIVTGCFFLTDTALWRELDGFDERFFMYAEEADYCRRARALGAHPRFTPSSEIIHYGGASEAVRAGQIIKVLSGKISLAKKHWPRWKVALLRVFYRLAVLIRRVGFATLGLISGGKRGRMGRQEWKQVWADRARWLEGY